MIERGRHSLDIIAGETGFAYGGRMRRPFVICGGGPSRDSCLPNAVVLFHLSDATA